MSRENESPVDESVWLKGHSELAIAIVEYFKKRESKNEILSILDIGCGNGRDAFYLSDNLQCSILGIDISKKAIDNATDTALKMKKENVKFKCCSFTELKEGKYYIVLSAGLYHFLKKNEREKFRKIIMRTLKPNGSLFLSTLSVGDTEYYGKGTPVPEEPNSFLYEDSPGNRVYLHFCTREELIQDFDFLNIKELYEYEDYDPRVKGPVNFIPWVLIGEYAGTSNNT